MMLDELLKKAVADFAAMSKDEQDAMFKSQITSLMKTEMAAPKSKFCWENRIKVYDSYKDYSND